MALPISSSSPTLAPMTASPKLAIQPLHPLSLLAGLLLVFGAFGGIHLSLELNAEAERTKAEGLAYAETQTDTIAQRIDTQLLAQKTVAEDLAKRIGGDALPPEAIRQAITEALETTPDLFGLVVGLAPGVHPSGKLYAPYYHLSPAGDRVWVQVEERYDYTDPQQEAAAWYNRPAQSGEAQWIRQYGRATEDWVLLYSVPILDQGRNFIGAVAAIHSIGTTLKDLLQSVHLGQEGYAALVSPQGLTVYHPSARFVGTTLAEAAEMLHDPLLAQAAQRQLRGESFILERQAANQTPSWTSFRALPGTGWGVITVVYRDVLAPPTQVALARQIDLGLWVLMALIGAVLLLAQPRLAFPKRAWLAVNGSSLALFLCLLWIWGLLYTTPREAPKTLVDHEDAANTLAKLTLGDLKPTVLIPTGVAIENLTIANNSVQLSGYLWQTYPLDWDASKIQPPHFPDASKRPELTESYRFNHQGRQVVGWGFRLELHQQFGFRQYPLDEVAVQLLIEPGNATDPVALTPDIAGYEFMQPRHKPGLRGNLKAPGWELLGSGFSYSQQASYGANLGSQQHFHKWRYPTLGFHIHAKRMILSPLTAYGIVICALMIQVFGLLMIPVDSPIQSISVSAAVFLVIAISHGGLRNNLDVRGTIYLEYFLIFMYLIILWVAMVSLTRTTKIESPLLAQEGLIFKLAYWPFSLATILGFTLLVFYPR
jgi:hypothetical protein